MKTAPMFVPVYYRVNGGGYLSTMRASSKIISFGRAAFGKDLRIEFEMVPLTVHRPTPRKLLSLLATEYNRIRPKSRVHGLPSVLQVEPTNSCNLKCPLCPSGRHALSRPIGMMSRELFEELMRQIGPGLSLVILWGWGEPMLHDDLPGMVRCAKSYRSAVAISTNGQLMCPKTADELVSSGTDLIIVAMDGATEDSYQRYRVGGSAGQVIETLRILTESKRRHNSRTPLVNLRMVVTKDNQEDIPLMKEIARTHAVDLLTLRGVAMTDLWEDTRDEDYLPGNSSLSMYKYEQGNRIKPGKFICRRPWKRATVMWDGTITLCEMDYSASAALGVFSQGSRFMDIWNGHKALEIRKRFLQDRLQFEFCARCPFNDRITEDCTLERVEVNG